MNELKLIIELALGAALIATSEGCTCKDEHWGSQVVPYGNYVIEECKAARTHECVTGTRMLDRLLTICELERAVCLNNLNGPKKDN